MESAGIVPPRYGRSGGFIHARVPAWGQWCPPAVADGDGAIIGTCGWLRVAVRSLAVHRPSLGAVVRRCKPFRAADPRRVISDPQPLTRSPVAECFSRARGTVARAVDTVRHHDRATQLGKIVLARRQQDVRPAADRHRCQRGRVSLHHGAVRRRQVDVAPYSGDARQCLERRVRVPRVCRARDETEGTRETAQAVHWLCVSELPLARRPDGLRKPGDPALIPQRQPLRARLDRLRLP
jgi:hypothetical protein